MVTELSACWVGLAPLEVKMDPIARQRLNEAKALLERALRRTEFLARSTVQLEACKLLRWDLEAARRLIEEGEA